MEAEKKGGPVLFVCTGNTCRSPMAAGLYTLLAKQAGAQSFAESAGLAANEGEPASRNAVLAMAELGVDLSAYRARAVTGALLQNARRILVMTSSHRALLQYTFPGWGEKAEVLGISDPYGGDLARYRACRDEIAAALGRAFAFSPAVEVVPLREEHLDAAARLEQLCFSAPWSRRALQEELTNPAAVYLAALVGGRVAGYAGMRHAAGEGYIDNIAVDPAFRRRGVATALLGQLEEFARRNHFAFLTLEVRPSNEPALRLYEKLGYMQAGRRRGFYTNPPEDALLLTKTLGAQPRGRI